MNIRPRSCWRASACRCRAAAWPISPDQAAYAATSRRRQLGGEGADPCRRPRQGRRHQALPHRTRGARRGQGACSARSLVTQQTGPEGKSSSASMSKSPMPFERELYLGFVLDRKTERVRVIASPAGGMEIEEIAAEKPEALIRDRGRAGGRHAAVPGPRDRLRARPRHRAGRSRPSTTIMGCYRAFRDLDATMVEINPLVVTKDDRMIALDAKMTLRRQRAVPPAATSPSCATRRRRTRARRRPPSTASTTSASRATSAASSTAPASPWRPWT